MRRLAVALTFLLCASSAHAQSASDCIRAIQALVPNSGSVTTSNGCADATLTAGIAVPSVAAIQQWLAANPPAPTLTFLQFMALFTPAEQAAIVNSTDTQTKLFLLMASGAGMIQLNNAQVIAGVNYLASGPGLITNAEAARILAGQTP